MRSNLLNFSLKSITDGVTEQYEEARYESQVEEMLNCVPSVVHGVTRRNPVEHVIKYSDGIPPNPLFAPFIYPYDRGDGNQYVVVQIHTPPAETDEQKAFYKQMEEKMPFHPRAHF